ncbi:MAG TPA: glycoside hydrolase family 38 C-terminal domain-containing protein [Mobilitalea sp.]|nr:glycoside hydrolase family 38 C-terminal domain-containing protein [Mobilitalea sp.]
MHTFNRHYDDMIQLLKKKVFEHVYTKIQPLKINAWKTKEPIKFPDRTSGEHRSLAIGDCWGEIWDCAWFHFEGNIPSEYIGRDLVLLIDINGELCVYDKEGTPICGLTNVSSTFDKSLGLPGKRVLPLDKGAVTVDLWADCGCNDLFGNYSDGAVIVDADIACIDLRMHRLFYDIEILADLSTVLPKNSARYQKIYAALCDVFHLMKNYDTQEAERGIERLRPELAKTSGTSSYEISAIGHSHIDLAWLWPIRETKRKALRTFSTVLKNMSLYEEYIYGSSQPQLYEWVKNDSPQLYERIKERIKEGRWEVQGGMWVEADTNVTGGESLVRQILYGKRFFKQEFGIDVKTLWLPDVFGYTAALPQILKKSGINYFMTIKLSWNEINKFPYHTFLWEGLDGSRVLAHMPPEGTYNSSGLPRAAHKTEADNLDLDVSDHALLLFGIGDGGGGPGEEHLESMKRIKNLNGLSPVVQEPSIDFFKKLEKNRDKYKTWVGELYLEIHQGTYTSQSENKKLNRRMEHKLCELELAAVMAHILGNYRYPQEELLEIWKEVLLYQFHDILPGSSIKRVYDESTQRYNSLLSKASSLMNEASIQLKGDIPAKNGYLLNSLSWNMVSYNKVRDIWYKTAIPPFAIAEINDTPYSSCSLAYGDDYLENNLIKVLFNSDGTIKSVYDKDYNKEVLTDDSNKLCIYDEINGNNWDFSPVTREFGGEQPILIEVFYSMDGPFVTRTNRLQYRSSTIEQSIVLTEDSKRIDFKTSVNWQERMKLLRTSFAVNVYTNHVNCNIQFGNLKRSNNNNTSWDTAKYEICAHKYVDLSQGDYGVALLNDCKYGHYVKNNILDLHLIRNNSYPNEDMDLGTHEFTYSLYPHKKDFASSDVVKEAYSLNRPPVIVPAQRSVASICSLDNERVVIESIKMAEDSNSCIVRLYECYGRQESTYLNLGFSCKKAYLCDLMEQEIEELDLSRPVTLKPFEILTVKIPLD